MRLERKLETWFWFLLKIFPMLMILFVFFSIKVSEPSYFATLEMTIEYILSFPIFTNILFPIAEFFSEFMPIEDGTNWYLILSLGMFSYALLIEILRIIFDLFVMVPRVVRSFVSNMGGLYDKI